MQVGAASSVRKRRARLREVNFLVRDSGVGVVKSDEDGPNPANTLPGPPAAEFGDF